jgi:hypothetical protein
VAWRFIIALRERQWKKCRNIPEECSLTAAPQRRQHRARIQWKYEQWQRKRLRRKSDVYYNDKHRKDDDSWQLKIACTIENRTASCISPGVEDGLATHLPTPRRLLPQLADLDDFGRQAISSRLSAVFRNAHSARSRVAFVAMPRRMQKSAPNTPGSPVDSRD